MIYHKPLAMLVSVALTAGGLAAIASPAKAQGQRLEVVGKKTDNPTRAVRYADLALASLEGQKMLKRRVASAVSSVCNEAVGETRELSDDRACHDFAWEGARPQMALAIQRARDIAATGSSSIAAAAVTITAPN